MKSQKELFYAVKANNAVEALRILNTTDVDPNGYNEPDGYVQSSSGYTTLHYAVYNNMPEVVEVLVRRNADVNKRDQGNASPMLLALRWGYWDCARKLALSTINIRQGSQTAHFGRALFVAITRNDYVWAMNLVLAGAYLDVCDSISITYLGNTIPSKVDNQSVLEYFLAYQHVNDDLFNLILSKSPTLLDSLFKYALAYENNDYLEKLLEKGLKPNQELIVQEANHHNWTRINAILNKVCVDRHGELLKTIANVLMKLAITQDLPEEVSFLLGKGADIDHIDEATRVQKKWACAEKFLEYIPLDNRELCRNNESLRNALYYIAKAGKISFAIDLINRGVDSHSVINNFWLIHFAVDAFQQHPDFLAKCLLRDISKGLAYAFEKENRAAVGRIAQSVWEHYDAETLLITQAERSSWDCINEFLTQVPPSWRQSNQSPIIKLMFEAIKQNNASQVRSLRTWISSLRSRYNFLTSVEYAVQLAKENRDFWQSIEALIENHPTDESDFLFYRDALGLAIDENDETKIEKLLALHTPTHLIGCNFLHRAIQVNCSVELFNKLMNDRNKNLANEEQKTPIQKALELGCSSICRSLIQNHVLPSFADITLAVNNKHWDTVREVYTLLPGQFTDEDLIFLQNKACQDNNLNAATFLDYKVIQRKDEQIVGLGNKFEANKAEISEIQAKMKSLLLSESLIEQKTKKLVNQQMQKINAQHKNELAMLFSVGVSCFVLCQLNGVDSDNTIVLAMLTALVVKLFQKEQPFSFKASSTVTFFSDHDNDNGKAKEKTPSFSRLTFK